MRIIAVPDLQSSHIGPQGFSVAQGRPVAPSAVRHYVLSCQWLYNRCLDRRLSQHGDLDKAVFDEEAIRLGSTSWTNASGRWKPCA
jgi:hypothetical protein